MKLFRYMIAAAAALTLASSCSEDFLETQSTSSVDSGQIFETTETAMMAVNGIHRLLYKQESTAPRMGFGTVMLWMDFLGEDLVYTKDNAQWKPDTQWTRHRNADATVNKLSFKMFYQIITNANMIIECIDEVEGTESDKNFIKGQALAYRAFAHHYLVQLWGERYYAGKTNSQLGVAVRLDNSTDLKARNTVEEVYTAINNDLDEAIKLLEATSAKRVDKSHIDVNVARGFKARVLLCQGRWAEAAAMAKKVVETSGASLDSHYYDFKQGRCCTASSSEWLWGKIGDMNIETVKLCNFYSYISNTNVSYNYNTPRAIYNLLYDKISDTDVRKSVWLPDAPKMDKTTLALPPNGNVYKWISQKYIVDYPDCKSASYNGALYTADLPYMRLPEMICIEAEAYARAGDEEAAKEAIYLLAKNRDPEYTKSTNSGQDLIDEILVQKRVELWGEGFRFLELKRLNMPLDRGPAPREGYNQGGAANNWKNGKTPTNLDPLASNFNMYETKPIGEENRYRAADSKEWQFVIPQSEIDNNPLCEQNPI